MYRFEHDWFSPNIMNLQQIFRGYQNPVGPSILEIGALEGRSTVWFLENIPNCKVTTIDTWKGGKDHSPDNPEINFPRIKENFDFNTSKFKDRLEAIESTSFDGLISLYNRNEKFDFVYVDGSHTAIDVNMDLILSFKLLRLNSIIYCDDYYWGFNDVNQFDAPKLGIDSFVNVYGNKLIPMIGLANNAATFIKVSE
jgi:predicted O-methyltransferase YrrM